MKRRMTSVFVCALVMTLSACAQQTSRPEEARPTPKAAIPSNSPLAKVKEGMGMKEVQDLIGPPTDTNSHVTGKAFIPFYYGPDSAEVEAYYKGMGRIVYSAGGFSGGARVISVEYDPNETGYSR